MRRRFSLYVRQHQSGWYTSSVLSHPSYSAYGPHRGALETEISEVLARDLASGALHIRGPTVFEAAVRRAVTIELQAVQHNRLITVPLKATVLSRRVAKDSNIFEVHIPRINRTFTIFGEDNIMPWTEEEIRGHFHLDDVSTLLAHQYERSERIEEIEVVYKPAVEKKRRGPSRAVAVDDAHPLDTYGVELVREAREGRLPRAQFRQELINDLTSNLEARTSPSALLVGAPGVGKTALVHELAHILASAPDESRFNGVRIWFIDGARFVAGAKFLGDWQERARTIVSHVTTAKDILFVGGLLDLLSVESGTSGLGIAQFLLPSIQSGELSLIAEVTPDALTRAEDVNSAFVHALQRIPVASLSLDLTLRVLEGGTARLSKQHKIRWAAATVSTALDVVARFGDASGLPGSGLSLLDRMARLATEGQTIEPSAAIGAFSKISGMPEALIDPAQQLDVESVRDFFRSRVIGQDTATDLLVELIMVLKAGLNDPERPLGSFMFLGPTGVGKTESASTLAAYLFGDRKRMIRLDMSELGYPGSAWRLVDGPNGEGDLTRPVREQPFCVVLFDEVEKADPEVFDLLLQILGEGRLTDGSGRTVSFAHAIVIMTSNLGAKRRDPVGFAGASGDGSKAYVEAVERFFRPELVNRIDHLVPFGTLAPDALQTIAVALLKKALAREGYARRGLTITHDPAVLDLVVKVGFDPRYGARPMKRAIESLVTVPLARHLMNASADLRRLHVSVEDGAVVINAD